MVNGKEMPRVGRNRKGMIEEREGERMKIIRGGGERMGIDRKILEMRRGDGGIRRKTVVKEYNNGEKKMSWKEETEGIRKKTVVEGIQQWSEKDELEEETEGIRKKTEWKEYRAGICSRVKG
jgi:hypothetical protein